MGPHTPTAAWLTLKRTAGTKGFEGTWESTDVKPAFMDAVIEDNGATGITILIPADNIKSPLTFDGKESTTRRRSENPAGDDKRRYEGCLPQ